MSYSVYHEFLGTQKNSLDTLNKLFEWMEENSEEDPHLIFDPDWTHWPHFREEMVEFTKANPDVELWVDVTGNCVEYWVLFYFSGGEVYSYDRITPLDDAIEALEDYLKMGGKSNG